MITHTIVIKPVPESIKEARDWVAPIIGQWTDDPDVLYIAKVVMSELVTNAFQHGSRVDDTITLRAYRADAGNVIEVWDRSSAVPKVQPFAQGSESGRGLAMLEMLVKAWGTENLAGGGKSVWAVL